MVNERFEIIWLMFFRCRIGTGVLNAIVPVWATETAEHTSRGQFIAIEFTLNIFGVVVAYWLEFGLSFIDGGRSPFRWRELNSGELHQAHK